MRVVFAGTPAVAVPSLEALIGSSHDVVAVLTRPDARAGRGRSLAASPVKQRALAEGIPVLTPTSLRDAEAQDALRELAPDCCPVVAYGTLVPRDALRIPAHGWVNLHFSLLPAWRGAAPVQRAIMAGDEITGATTFLLEEGLDTGPVLGRMTETIRPQDTSGELLDRLAVAGSGLLVETLDAIESGEIEAVPQRHDGISQAPKLTAADAEVDWSRPAFAVDRQVRGCTPDPGAWTVFRGERLGLGPVHLDSRPDLAPGEIEAGKRDVAVGTGTVAVRLTTVRPQGKREMAAADWARGVRITDQDVMGA
ncbi:methionyl-tRNA formyltransferase [Arsenicicoccus sp. oral taxon 190]|uniref:methionyl-tRNA formyltransferase n=1 Tax=Arsenicicoccus sp. oral taxon 190 TaxID=1658671 RepID=UPI000679F181|nr:methionyl-tRNA formyltransferase [Arsenicicoccus sp. oral taxon 190]AKT51725.1 methionyl-tRNA formyltransferase [Arsenicicoccus sp. oral taxon 190]